MPRHTLAACIMTASLALALATMARALDPILTDDELRQEMRGEPDDPAGTAFSEFVKSYALGLDDQAIAQGERLFEQFPEEAKNREQAGRILAEARRRKAAGGVAATQPDDLAEDFANLPVARQVELLIQSLDEVNARQTSWPGGVDMAADWRVAALIRIGDPAVPALIDAVEKDNRLTRTVHTYRFRWIGTVLQAREPALVAVMSILRLPVFEPESQADNFTSHGPEKAKAVADELRAYWAKFGHLTLDQRLMGTLTDPTAGPAEWRDAAQNLATLDEYPVSNTTRAWQWRDLPKNPARLAAAISRFDNPTIAEAMLAAMDRDVPTAGYSQDVLGEHYLGVILRLGDKRIGPELIRRAATADTVADRLRFAASAQALGKPEALNALARELVAGRIATPAAAPPGDRRVQKLSDDELFDALNVLTLAGTPDAEAALIAVVDPKHPYHAAAARVALKFSGRTFADLIGEFVKPAECGNWNRHPSCLAILRQQLDNTTRTGDRTPCKLAAERLGDLVWGLPPYDPLLEDADQVLEQIRAFMDLFAGRWRPATADEPSAWRAFVLPDIKPLGRPATEADVKAGRAIFHLDGRGRVAPIEFPAVGWPPREEQEQQGLFIGEPLVEELPMLIVQAEIDADGETIYGAIGRFGLVRVAAEELASIRPLAGPQTQPDE